MRMGTFVLVFLLLHVVACRQQKNGVQSQATSVRSKQAEEKKNIIMIKVGAGQGFSYSAPQSCGTTGDVSCMEDLIRELDKTVLAVDGTSNPEMVHRFVDTYLGKPGFWKEIALGPGDPDKRWEGYDVRLSMDKTEFVQDEPVPVTMSVTTDDPWGSPWWFLSPDHLRVQDAQGRDVSLFHRPVSGFDNRVRSKVFVTAKERTADLTSFVEPYHGIEFVNRFEPGTYSVTFYFSFDWPHQDNCIEPEDFAYPCVWGPKKSNTVTFTVRAAESKPSVNIDALFEKGGELVAKSKANDAVRTYKQVILNTVDQQLIEKAILQILLIRSVSAHDDEGLYEKPEEEAKKPLPERIRVYLKENVERFGGLHCVSWLGPLAFRLSVLHLAGNEARRWYGEYIGFRAGEFDWDTPEGRELTLRWDEADGARLFHFPLYRALLMADLGNAKGCPRQCAEIYLRLPGEKDVELLRKLLHKHPDPVLEHFCEVPPPRELLPDIERYFDDRTSIWGESTIKVERRDAAYLAFERAVGLRLGLRRLDADRVRQRDAILEILEDWRRRHSETKRTKQ